MSYLDFQLLLYVPSEQYEPCRTFYEQVFATQPFYGWDEGPEDLPQMAAWAAAEANPVYPVPVIFGKEDFIRVARRVMP